MIAEPITTVPVEAVVGESSCMQQLRQRIIALSACDVNLLLQGESGTGKELVSRTVHKSSNRSTGPFIGVNCAAIHESLLESELFGHEAGAFTGAGHSTLGFLRAGDGGTVLLDEIGDMSPSLQSKLLRVLEERAVVPVGGVEPVHIDVRVIAATHCDLAAAVRRGEFRQDLYYRVNVVRLRIPPLRERREDIPILAEHLLRQISGILGIPLKTISPATMEILLRHDWPGNIRELGNVIQRGYVLGTGAKIEPADLPEELLAGAPIDDIPIFPTLREATRIHVRRALEMSGGVRGTAARLLGVDRKSLWRMMNRFSLD